MHAVGKGRVHAEAIDRDIHLKNPITHSERVVSQSASEFQLRRALKVIGAPTNDDLAKEVAKRIKNDKGYYHFMDVNSCAEGDNERDSMKELKEKLVSQFGMKLMKLTTNKFISFKQEALDDGKLIGAIKMLLDFGINEKHIRKDLSSS